MGIGRAYGALAKEICLASIIKHGTLEERSYQIEITSKALKGNTLVVLPTGLGKTAIAAIVAAEASSLF